MDLYLKIIYGLLVASWILFIIMFILLSSFELFSKSLFFSFGGKFSLLGVTFEDQSFYISLGFLFFFNSFLSTLNINIIAPVFSRIMFSHPEEEECHNENYRLDKETLYYILFFYDTWLVVRSLFNLLGILSNIGFFIATSMGFLIGDLTVKYIYINDPMLFNFHPKTKYSKIEEKEIFIEEKPKLKSLF